MESQTQTAQQIFDAAITDDETFAEWIVEYLIADYYTASVMKATKLAGRWNARKQANHDRAKSFLAAIGAIMMADPVNMTKPASVIRELGNAAFWDKARELESEQ